jgi:hypothetical protein
MEDAIAEICRMLILAAHDGSSRLPPLHKDLMDAAKDILGLRPQPKDEFGLYWLAYNIEHLQDCAAAAGLNPDKGEREDLHKFRQAISKAAKDHIERKQRSAARVQAWKANHA